MNSLIDIDKLERTSRRLSATELSEVFKYVKERVITQKSKPEKDQWEKYWEEMLNSGQDHPSFFLKKRFQNIYRLNGSFAEINGDTVCVSVLQEILSKINSLYLKDCDFLVEFGSGTGSNIKYISELNQNISSFGSDFSESSLGILKRKGLNSFFFDMKNPSLSSLPKIVQENLNRTAFLTSGSMEQLGDAWRNFVDFVLEVKPSKIINIEPIYEYYDDSEFDSLARQFHLNKKYFSGYVNFLKDKKIHLIEHRHKFGTLFDEGFNTIITSP